VIDAGSDAVRESDVEEVMQVHQKPMRNAEAAEAPDAAPRQQTA
jgi:hypothetical protein